VSKSIPYTAPRVIRYESEAEYPDWTLRIVRSLRQELEAELAPQFEVEPQEIALVDSDGKYVEVSDSFCQLFSYQREELIGQRYDDLTAPNTNDVATVFGLLPKLGYTALAHPGIADRTTSRTFIKDGTAFQLRRFAARVPKSQPDF
jgi:PAS domain S-box-containing protein